MLERIFRISVLGGFWKCIRIKVIEVMNSVQKFYNCELFLERCQCSCQASMWLINSSCSRSTILQSTSFNIYLMIAIFSVKVTFLIESIYISIIIIDHRCMTGLLWIAPLSTTWKVVKIAILRHTLIFTSIILNFFSITGIAGDTWTETTIPVIKVATVRGAALITHSIT